MIQETFVFLTLLAKDCQNDSQVEIMGFIFFLFWKEKYSRVTEGRGRLIHNVQEHNCILLRTLNMNLEGNFLPTASPKSGTSSFLVIWQVL